MGIISNFTVDENTPSDQEVSVDPEMLGKIFENLLALKDRKSMGAFYTPREVVHHMCRESLINHLISKSEIPEERLRRLFDAKDAELFILADEDLALKSKKLIELNEIAEKVDVLLRGIKIIDPAVGSGAFPMGMLSEISSTRYYLNNNFLHKIGPRTLPLSLYDIKRETLENCIYGVDIDSGAVDIAKLRFWLALVVDHNIDEIEALPNLDFKIMQGNSLLEEYEGLQFYSKQATGLFEGYESEDLRMVNLSRKKKEYFKEASAEQKKILKEEINALFGGFVSSAIFKKEKELGREAFLIKFKYTTDDLISKYAHPENEKPFFIWKLYYSEVFEKGGFDVVIGNPPYTSVSNSEYTENTFHLSAKRLSNTYSLFMELALSLASPHGSICLIVPNTWLSIDSCEKLRQHFIEECSLKFVLQTFQIFQSINTTPPVVDTVIYLLEKIKKENYNITFIELSQNKTISERLDQVASKKWGRMCIMEKSNFQKTEKYKFIDNEFNLKIETFKLEEGIEPMFLVRIGCQEYAVGGGIPAQTKEMIKTKIYHSSTKMDESFKKFVPCGDIQKYFIKPSRSFIKWGSNLHCPRDKSIYSHEHLLVSRIFDKKNRKLKVGLLNKEDVDFSVNNTDSFSIIKSKDDERYTLKSLLGILSSSTVGYLLVQSNINLKRLVYPKINTKDLKNIPFPKLSSIEQKQLEDLVSQILAITQTPGYDVQNPPTEQSEKEREIDDLVMTIYKISDEERVAIQNSK